MFSVIPRLSGTDAVVSAYLHYKMLLLAITNHVWSMVNSCDTLRETILTMDSQNGKTDEKHIEEAENGKGVILSKYLDFSGELVTLDNGVLTNEIMTELPAKEQSRILRKVDLRIVPLLTFLYLVAFIDRTNSASALMLVGLVLVLTRPSQSEMPRSQGLLAT